MRTRLRFEASGREPIEETLDADSGDLPQVHGRIVRDECYPPATRGTWLVAEVNHNGGRDAIGIVFDVRLVYVGSPTAYLGGLISPL